ncbi:MAG: diacylglycerol kinase family lipid kinase [Candidatus Izemoplasmatales bacterium]|nr:diacylglycerol kinase family lipid kinase [Candidatus Izemoplasmatales bacterium]
MKRVILVAKAILIYNPKSGKQDFISRLPHVIYRLNEKGYQVQTLTTTYPGQATEFARQACQERYELLLIVGGDGTFNECVNGMMDCKDLPKIGYLPVGTCCDIGHSLGLSKNVDLALDNIFADCHVKMDVVKSNDRYFCYVTGNGAYIDISYVTDSRLKKKIGYLAYLIKGTEELFTIPKIRMRVIRDGVEFAGSYSLILIINSKRVAGINMIYKPYLDDGLVNVVMYHYLWPFNNIIYFLSFILPFWSTPLIKRFKTSKMQVITESKSKWNVDGESGGWGNQQIEVYKQAIIIIVPEKIKKKYFPNQE